MDCYDILGEISQYINDIETWTSFATVSKAWNIVAKRHENEFIIRNQPVYRVENKRVVHGLRMDIAPMKSMNILLIQLVPFFYGHQKGVTIHIMFRARGNTMEFDDTDVDVKYLVKNEGKDYITDFPTDDEHFPFKTGIVEWMIEKGKEIMRQWYMC